MTIPAFYLYGEPHRTTAKDFVHIERLDVRSRPNEWTIRAHTHAALEHLFLLSHGGGSLAAEGRRIPIAPPGLLLIPARTAHGFDFQEDTRGWVVTIASAYLAELIHRHPAFGGLFLQVRTVPLSTAQGGAIERRIADAARELGWSAGGQRAAVEAELLALLVGVLRAIAATDAPAADGRAGDAAIVARFRERVEQRFRLREPVPAHAAALGVSLTALRVACARIAGMPPALILDRRAMLEAQRALLYSDMSVAQIAYATGFGDPAYFSRFFARHAGCAPRVYRARGGG